MSFLNHRLVTGKFAIQGEARAGDPDERMKPQQTQSYFMDETNQVVASFCVGEFVEEDRIEFMFAEQAVNATGKRDVGVKDAVDCGRLSSCGEPYGNAMSQESASFVMSTLAARLLCVAMLGADSQTKPREHQGSTKQPQHGEHSSNAAF